MATTTTYSFGFTRPKFIANSNGILNSQFLSNVTALSGGGFALTYVTENGANDVPYVSIYNTATGAERPLFLPYNVSGTDLQGEPVITQLTNGNVVVVWKEGAGGSNRIVATTFDPLTGNAVGPREVVLNTAAGDTDVEITAFSGDRYVITYVTSAGEIRYHIRNSDGSDGPSAVLIGTNLSDPAIVATADGGLVVVLVNNGSIQSTTIDSNGNIITVKNEVSGGTNSSPQIAALKGGGFAIVYDDADFGGQPGIGLKLSTAAQDVVIRVDTFVSAKGDRDPEITVLENGFIVVTWTHEHSGADDDIYGHIFDANGNSISVADNDLGGGVFVIDSSVVDQNQSSLAALLNGMFVTTWTNAQGDVSGDGISGDVRELTRTITGDADGNIIFGDELRETIFGGGGIDQLAGGKGNDSLHGDAGDDTLVVGPGDGVDGAEILDGGIDFDNLLLAIGEGGDFTFDLRNDVITSIERIVLGGNFANFSATTVVLNADQFGVGVANAAVFDRINNVVPALTVFMEDEISLNLSALQFNFNYTVTINGDSDAETITGTTQNDTINGGEGGDTITGGVGTDVLNGEGGDDTFVLDDDDSSPVGGTFDGGVGTSDRLLFQSSSIFSNTIFDLRNATLNGIEVVEENTRNDIVLRLMASQFGAGIALDAQFTTTSSNGNLVEIDMGSELDLDLSALTLTSAADWSFTVTGGIASETITGTDSNDVINGNGGGDVLDGGNGNDTLFGDAGNDTFILQLGAGNDTFIGGDDVDTLDLSALTTTALDINLAAGTWGNTGAVFGEALEIENAIGSNVSDTITGTAVANELTGNGGDDTLNGGGGVDTTIGGSGNDTHIVDNALDVIVEGLGEGTNDRVAASVTFVLNADDDIERLTTNSSTETTAINLTGNARAQAITGNAGANTLSEGGVGGSDTLTGLGGNDTYIVNNKGAIIVETTGQGTNDRVQTSDNFILNADDDIEVLETTNAAGTIGFTLTGNALTQAIIGNAGANSLNDGGAGGNDTLTGLGGNDTYIVNNEGAIIVETTGQGTNDRVQTSVYFFLAADDDIEVLETTNVDATNLLVLTGNALAQQITGNAGVNYLDDGGAGGNDTLTGLGGDDYYFVNNTGTVIVETTGQGTEDSVFTTVSFTLAADDDIETLGTFDSNATTNLSLTGNALAQTIVGNAGNNVLRSMTGAADRLIGYLGDDTYRVFNAGDIIEEFVGAGTADRVITVVNYTLGAGDDIELFTTDSTTGTANLSLTGNELSQTITGNAGNNILDGAAGADTLVGGLGDDTYVLGAESDTVTEAAGAAGGAADTITSTITRSLASHGGIENLTLLGAAAINGTGNALANTITGNSGNNVLDGAAGADTLVGGLGDDTYVLGADSDTVTEAAGAAGGTADTITSTITRSLASHGGIENLTLLGAAAVNGTGNALANTITGNSGNNVLDGGNGADTLHGGSGADSLIGGSGSDFASYFNDAAVTVSLDGSLTATGAAAGDTFSSIENISGSNTGNDTISGNANANQLIGNGGSDSLSGAIGNDTLSGGAGNDTLDGGAGSDTVSFADRALGVALNPFINTAVIGGAEFDTILNFENFTGSGGNDILQGTFGVNVISGFNGDDLIYAFDGADIIDGGAGADVIAGGADADTITGGDGGDWLYGENGNDLVSGTAKSGGAFDVMIGGLGNDTLEGSAGGFDYFYGGAGVNGATGDGNDSYIVRAGTGIKVMNDFEAGGAVDAVRLLGTGFSSFAQVQAAMSFSGVINGTVLVVDAQTQIWFLNGTQPANLTAADFLYF